MKEIQTNIEKITTWETHNLTTILFFSDVQKHL